MANPPTLTDRTGMGGIIAIDGFEYQRWDAICRIPAWIKNRAFEGVTIEGLEDVEARFFSPHSAHGHVIERYQAKSGSLTPSQITEVFENFKLYEESFPGTSLLQTLVTPALPPTLSWIGSHAGRIKRAERFYQPFTEIMDLSEIAFQHKLEGAFPGDLGSFVAKRANLFLRSFEGESAAASTFFEALGTAYPNVALDYRSATALFGDLNALLRHVGQMIDRKSIEAILGKHLNFGDSFARAVPVRILSEASDNSSDYIDIDASAFSDGSNPNSDAAAWEADLQKPLLRTANWLRTNGHSRLEASGRFRLSTAFLLGNAFRSSSGFDIEVPVRDGIWKTDDHPEASGAYSEWEVLRPEELLDDRLVASVGILRDPKPHVLQHMNVSNSRNVLSLRLPNAITSGVEAQAAVQFVKQSISSSCSNLKASEIYLFFAGPAAFAVALGHRWNGMPRTQLFEFVSASSAYVPTAQVA